MAGAIIMPRIGLDWNLVKWGAPNEPRTEHCSYCGNPLPEDSVPLILWTDAGCAAEFCDDCQKTWWGLQAVDGEGDEPDLERSCRVCGCTDERACPGGCYWVEADLCSACANRGEG